MSEGTHLMALGYELKKQKEKYAKLYDEHCGHDCEVEDCRKWEVDQIQERYNFILEMTGEYK